MRNQTKWRQLAESPLGSSSPEVVVVFADCSLGGTSRSAFNMGRAWKVAGYGVRFLAVKGVHPSRISEFCATGPVYLAAREINWATITTIHLHHGVWTRELSEVFAAIIQEYITANIWPCLVTHNIFGEPVRELVTQWRGQVVVGTLGWWSRAQYYCNGWPMTAPEVVEVIPNPQDAEFFRKPTECERRTAQLLVGGSDRRTVLRIGSPIDSKWSSSYIVLGRSLCPPLQLVCVGAPTKLAAALGNLPHCFAYRKTGDDVSVRNYYWASDVLAVDARQGESFGNVILEALMCGVPVVYRARPWRDNTPWEFRGVPGFYYANSRVEWIRKIAEIAMARREFDAEAELQQYMIAAVGAKLRSIAVWRPPPERPRVMRGLATRDLVCVVLRHNLVAFCLRRTVRTIRRSVPRVDRSTNVTRQILRRPRQ